MNEDTNEIIREFLVNRATLTGVVGTRIYTPRLIEKATLPAVSFFTRGGSSTPYIPGIVTPSVQFDCWAKDIAGTSGPIGARAVYNALYDVLQGIQMQTVTVGGTDYKILSAIEEVQGMDLVDSEILTYFKVLTFFSIMITATT